MGKKKEIHQLSNKELLKDLLVSVTDLEKKVFLTVYDLFTQPGKVINTYIAGNPHEYLSVFRYLILTIFVSYLGYSLLYKPGEIDGPFYTSLKSTIESGVNASGKYENLVVTFEKESFDKFYLEYNRIVGMLFKFLSTLGLLASFIVTLFFFRKMKFNIAGHLVIATYFGSQVSLVSLCLIIVESFFNHDVIFFSYINFIPIFFYSWFFYYRVSGWASMKGRFLTFCASFSYILVLLALQATFSGVLTGYVKSYMPVEIIKKDIVTGKIVE